jgi:hypothetical protein
MGNSWHSCMIPLIFTSTLRTASRPVCFYPRGRAPASHRWEGRTMWEQTFTSLQRINAWFLNSPHSSFNPGSLCKSPSTYTSIIWQDLEERPRQLHSSIPAELYIHVPGMSAMTSNSVTGNFLHVMAIFIQAQSFKVTLFTGMQDRLALTNLYTCQPCYSYS